MSHEIDEQLAHQYGAYASFRTETAPALVEYHIQGAANLSNWRLPDKPYEAHRDWPALELYARYNTTSKGIRLLRQRKVFVLRRAPVTYYPVDGLA
jgi:hypothetical protein